VTKTLKCHKVQKCDIVTFENVTKCHKMSHFFKSLVKATITIYVWIWLGTTLRAVPSRISKQKQKQVCTSHTECVTNL